MHFGMACMAPGHNPGFIIWDCWVTYSAMLIRYISDALNKKSTQFPRLLISGFVAALVGGLFLFLTDQFALPLYVYGAYGLFITLTPRLIFGIVIPAIVKLIFRHTALQNIPKTEAH